MKGIRLPIAAAVTLALFAIVAAMQWRWIAQLGDAELDRDRIRLRVGARNIQTDLNRELSRAYNLFQWESGVPPQSWAAHTAEAYAIWQSTRS